MYHKSQHIIYMYKHTDLLEMSEHIFGMIINPPWETNYIFSNLVSTAK